MTAEIDPFGTITPRVECPHCGCGYWIYGNTPHEALCHDCGRTFEVEPDPEVDERLGS